MENHAPRSTSGNSRIVPDFGGHSSAKLLLRSCAGSSSPGAAQAQMTLPLALLMGLSGTNGPLTENPVSSVNSRCAAANGSSPGAHSPLGMDQAPSSLRAQ